MRRNLLLCKTLFAALLLSGMPAAAAEESPFVFQPSVFSTLMMQPHIKAMLENNMRIARGENWSESKVELRAHPPAKDVETTSNWPAAVEGEVVGALALAYPPEQQAAAKALFTEFVVGYRKIEAQYGIPKNDIAGATAFFIAGSYMAYSNTDFPDAYYGKLVEQARGILASTPGFASASAADKGALYTQFAVLGMLTMTTQMALKETPAYPAAKAIEDSMRQAGSSYLELFLSADAKRVEIGPMGLDLR